MPPKPTLDPGLLAKDAIRGVRFVLKRGAQKVAEKGPRQLPDELEVVSTDILHVAKKIADRADKIVTRLLGLNFDQARISPPKLLSNGGAEYDYQTLSQEALNLYQALSLAAKNLDVKNVLVSEALCARIVAQAAEKPVPTEDTETKACRLFLELMSRIVIGDPPGISSHHNADHIDDLAMISFSVALWIFVERGSYQDTEIEILQICSDIAKFHRADILEHKSSSSAMIALFKHALDTV